MTQTGAKNWLQDSTDWLSMKKNRQRRSCEKNSISSRVDSFRKFFCEKHLKRKIGKKFQTCDSNIVQNFVAISDSVN